MSAKAKNRSGAKLTWRKNPWTEEEAEREFRDSRTFRKTIEKIRHLAGDKMLDSAENIKIVKDAADLANAIGEKIGSYPSIKAIALWLLYLPWANESFGAGDDPEIVELLQGEKAERVNGGIMILAGIHRSNGLKTKTRSRFEIWRRFEQALMGVQNHMPHFYVTKVHSFKVPKTGKHPGVKLDSITVRWPVGVVEIKETGKNALAVQPSRYQKMQIKFGKPGQYGDVWLIMPENGKSLALASTQKPCGPAAEIQNNSVVLKGSAGHVIRSEGAKGGDCFPRTGIQKKFSHLKLPDRYAARLALAKGAPLEEKPKKEPSGPTEIEAPMPIFKKLEVEEKEVLPKEVNPIVEGRKVQASKEGLYKRYAQAKPGVIMIPDRLINQLGAAGVPVRLVHSAEEVSRISAWAGANAHLAKGKERIRFQQLEDDLLKLLNG